MIFGKSEHPIERIMENAFDKIKAIADADTVIGSPVTTIDGVVIVPVSRVSMGFVTGGGEYSDMSRTDYVEYPFAGGSGAGMSITPIGFLIDDGTSIRMMSVESQDDAYTKLIDMLPSIIKGFVKSD